MNRFQQKVTFTLEEYQAICKLQDADMMTSGKGYVSLCEGYNLGMMRCNTSVNTENVKHPFKSTKSSPDCPLPTVDARDRCHIFECSEYVLYLYLLGAHIQTVVDMKGGKTSFCIHLLIPGYCSGLHGGMHQSDRCYLFKGSTVETNNIQNVLYSAIHF